MTDKIKAKRKRTTTRKQTTIYKTPYRKLRVEHKNPTKRSH